MNRLTQMFRRLTDINPVTLKELRQLVRTRFILWAMFLYPMLLLVVTACTLSSSLESPRYITDPLERTYEHMMCTAGPSILGGVIVPLALLTVIAIPLFTGIRLARETARGRMDLQFTTALTSQDVVSGKMMGAFLISLMFASISLPFLTLAYLMRGIELSQIAWAVLDVLALSLVTTSIAVTLGSLRLPVGLRVTLLALAFVFAGFYCFVGLVAALFDSSFIKSFESGGTQLVVLLCAGIVAALGRAWAAANLMPEHTDFKRRLRVLEFALVVFVCALGLIGAAVSGAEEWGIAPLLAFIYLTANCALSTFLPSAVSRIIRARAPKGFWGRLRTFPFISTAASGVLFSSALALVAFLSLLGTLVLTDEPIPERPILMMGSFFGQFMLLALLVVLVFRANGVRRKFFAVGPLIVVVILCMLQMGGILEVSGVIMEADYLPCKLTVLEDSDLGAQGAHYVYGVISWCCFLPYLLIDVVRTFRGHRRQEVAAK